MLCRLWYSPLALISSSSVDKWVTSAWDEDKDVPGLGGERQKLAQGAALSIMGPPDQYQ
jgi:hypothetical protein